MKNSITALYNFRVKQIAIGLAFLTLLIDIIIRFSSRIADSYSHHVSFHFFILIALMIAVGSKDRINDELSMQIRYGILKISYSFTVGLLGIIAFIFSYEPINRVSPIVLIYCLEATMLIHLIVYYIGVRFAPKWLLKEPSASKSINIVTIVVLFVFFAVVLLGFIHDTFHA